jgi:hypothetical protein
VVTEVEDNDVRRTTGAHDACVRRKVDHDFFRSKGYGPKEKMGSGLRWGEKGRS